MYHRYTYPAVLAASLRAQWNLDDVFPPDRELDFSRDFMPESLCGTAEAPGLRDNEERRILNQITAFQYLVYFASVEEFILPFLMDHARPALREGDYRVRALLNFANEEAKHIHLFRRFRVAFSRGFKVRCKLLGPPDMLARTILAHHPLAVGLVILMIEWMTQAHYVGAIRSAEQIDPLFESLFRHHWMEEAQHAKLDTLIVDALAAKLPPAQRDVVGQDFLKIVNYLDRSLAMQVRFNVDTLETALDRKIADRDALIEQQYRTARWTYLGSGLSHPRFQATLRETIPALVAKVPMTRASGEADPKRNTSVAA